MAYDGRWILVALNGTTTNPYHKFGLQFNPIPQTSDPKYDQACLQMQKLGGAPIPDTDYIRKTLAGFSETFVDLCCSHFRKGQYIKFEVRWPRD